MTHWYVWHDSLICDMTHVPILTVSVCVQGGGCVWQEDCMCDMSSYERDMSSCMGYVWHDSRTDLNRHAIREGEEEFVGIITNVVSYYHAVVWGKCHVARTNESCRTYEWVMSHVRMSRIATCHVATCNMTHFDTTHSWMRHIAHMQ